MKTKRRILVVDDEKGSLQLIGGILRFYYDISMALNGKMALRVLQNPDIVIDLVILDINMPVMDGLQVLENMKKLNINKSVIMLTGESGTVPLRSSQQSDLVIKYMKKPPNSSILLEEISNFFGKQLIKQSLAKSDIKKKPKKKKSPDIKINSPEQIANWQGVIGIVSKIRVKPDLKVIAITMRKEIEFSMEKKNVWQGVGVPSKGTAVVLAKLVGIESNFARPYDPQKDKHLFGKEIIALQAKLKKK